MHIFVCMHVCMHVCIPTYACAHACRHARAQACIAQACMYVCMCACLLVCMSMCMRICVMCVSVNETECNVFLCDAKVPRPDFLSTRPHYVHNGMQCFFNVRTSYQMAWYGCGMGHYAWYGSVLYSTFQRYGIKWYGVVWCRICTVWKYA